MNDLRSPETPHVDFQAAVDSALADISAYRGQGTLPSYIPTLAQIDPRKLGLALALGDGSSYVSGDADEKFTIQSIANVFTLSLGLQHVGAALWNHVGKEASGSATNAIVQLEMNRGKPRNPLINAGAIVVADQLIGDDSADVAFEDLLDFLRERADDDSVSVDGAIAMSESQAGALNRSFAYFEAAFDHLRNAPEEVLSLYFRQCAIMMSCREIARSALYLAFEGADPISGEQVIPANRCRRILATMMTCGHYDNSGEFAFRIGLPGKSSVSGAILAVAPGHGAVAVWSPGLNSAGTSLAGMMALEKLVDRIGWSVFK